MNRRIVSALAPLALIAYLLLGETASVAHAQDLSGVYRGRWTADATARRPEHGGSLRVRLRPGPGNSYKGLFMGRFAIVIPYIYRADVYQYGNQLVSTKKLGPMGSYRMTLSHRGSGRQGSQLNGRWATAEHGGNILLRRRR